MKSIIALSMHKAGSSIADIIFLKFAEAKKMDIDRISLIVPSSPLTEAEIFINYQDKMHVNGVYYGIVRGHYVEQMNILPYLKLIAQVRDPRDCITSAYFSFQQSHTPPTDPEKLKLFNERRDHLENQGIDEYAVSQAGDYRRRMRILRNIIMPHDDVLLLRYEDMVERTDTWLRQISKFLDQELTHDLRVALAPEIDFTVATEDTSKHKRQVSPGDHKRQLRPETIDRMTEIMKNELQFFGY